MRDGDLHTTVSVGVATLDELVTGLDRLLELADSALYEAKHAGRNRVGVAAWPAQPWEPAGR